MNILLDLDGVLADFLSLALERCNDHLYPAFEVGGGWTPESYAVTKEFDIAKAYSLTPAEFWGIIEHKDRFWCNLNPFPWAKELYEWLCSLGDVTICTSPSLRPACASQKIEWCKKHLDIGSDRMMIGGRKHLMARRDSLLIDDYAVNCSKFEDAGGCAIQVPSNWNTNPLDFATVAKCIRHGIATHYGVLPSELSRVA